MPRISLIVAMARNRVIGRDGALPWHLPEDLRHFRELTMGKPIVMGRLTHESIGRPLPGRDNIVVSRNREWSVPGCEVVGSLDAALERAALLAGADGEVMIIGGARIYAAALPRAERIYLTRVEDDIDGDTRFPELDTGVWQAVSTSGTLVSSAGVCYSFEVLEPH